MMQTAADVREPDIIAAARRGDANAFTLLVQRYQSPVYNLAHRLLGDASEADDAAQETLVRVYTQLWRYDARQHFAPWLMSIATHFCMDRLRRRKHVGASLDDDVLKETLATEQPEPEAIAL